MSREDERAKALLSWGYTIDTPHDTTFWIDLDGEIAGEVQETERVYQRATTTIAKHGLDI